MMHTSSKKKLTLSFFFATLLFSSHSISKENISSFVAQAKEQAASDLSDPDSVKFRKLEVKEFTGKDGKKQISLCGEINGKNRFGGYVGFRPFLVNEGPTLIVEGQSAHVMIDVWNVYCGPNVKTIKVIK